MPISEKPRDEGQLYTSVDDEQFNDLSELNGQPVVHAGVWEEGLAESIASTNSGYASASDTTQDDGTEDGVAADIDLYLRDGVYFELYGTLCYTDLDAPPLADLAEIEQQLQEQLKTGLKLLEIAVDEEDGLVVILGRGKNPLFYLQVGAWLLDEWEELPESAST